MPHWQEPEFARICENTLRNMPDFDILLFFRPLRCLCYKARGDRRVIEVNHRLNEYKRKAWELLTSEEGLRLRGRRCIEPEAVFGQMKFDMAYRRFRHFGKDKATMDFAFFAIAFNIKRLC